MKSEELSIEDILNLLRSGTTIEELEKEHGVTRQDLEDMLISKRQSCGCARENDSRHHGSCASGCTGCGC